MAIPRRSLVGFFMLIALVSSVYLIAQYEEPRSAGLPATSIDIPRAEAAARTSAGFPAAELQSALTDVCSNTATESADKVWTQEEIQAQIDSFNDQKQALSENLSASSSAEHLHVAAILEDDPASRFELIQTAILRSPSDPFLVWGAVRICSETTETMQCPLRDWERLLIAVDGQNSESWIRVAANRYAASEFDEALEAMRHAATGAVSRAYWTEMIEMIERGFAAGSDFGFPERAEMAFGVAASMLPRYGDYVKMCEERSAQSVDWGYACLAYGELVESQGKTEIGAAIARSIQRLALEGLGEVEKAEEVQRRIEARRQERLRSINDYDPAIERLIFSNPTLLSAYLAAIRSVGEETARKKITIEVERLIERQPALSCGQGTVR